MPGTSGLSRRALLTRGGIVAGAAALGGAVAPESAGADTTVDLPTINVRLGHPGLTDAAGNTLTAAGDGTTNDQPALQAMIDHLNAATTTEQRGMLYFPPGTYRLNARLLLYKGIGLLGAGRGVSILAFYGSTSGGVISATDVAHVAIRDLTVQDGVPGRTATAAYGLYFVRASDVSVERVEILYPASTGVLLRDSRRCVVEACHIQTAPAFGVHVAQSATPPAPEEGNNSQVVIRDCRISDDRLAPTAGLWAGIYLNAVTHSVVANNAISRDAVDTHKDDALSAGGGVVLAGLRTRQVTVTDNVISRTRRGVVVRGGTAASIAGNCIVSSGLHGILVASTTSETSGTVLTGNSISNCWEAEVGLTDSGAGIELSGATSGLVAGNTLRDSLTATRPAPRHRYGVKEAGSADVNYVVDNLIHGLAAGGAGVSLTGLNSASATNLVKP